MDKNCCECSELVKNLNLIKCFLCDCVAHIKCLNWLRSNLDFVNGQSNLLWFCSSCIKSAEQLKSQGLTDTTETIVSSVTDAINCSLNGVKDEINQSKELIKTISEKLLLNTTLTPKQRTKRPRVTTPTVTPMRSRAQIKLVGGTRSAENFPKAVETVPKPAGKFWIYLSRIAPNVTEEEIAAFVQECLSCSDPVVKKLVKKDADLKSFAFVSFKVGIDEQLKNQALDPALWPKGIYFRAFEQRNLVKDFWEPKISKLPRIVSPVQSADTQMNAQ